MTWHITEDAAAFRAAADEHFAAEPARNTVLLTLSEGARRRPVADARYGWWTEPDGRVTGAFLFTLPHEPALGPMPAVAARALAHVLPDAAEVTSVRGEEEPAEALARELCRGSGRSWTTTRRMRLHRLGTLTPPDPAPAGRARTAGVDDIPLAVEWMRHFARDIGEDGDVDFTPNIAPRVADGRLHLWETEEAGPVSMASVSQVVAGQARVSPVFTPAGLRGRGYAGAVTTAVSRAAMDAGAEQVLLFTDVANPTSNALYRRLGYRPVTDHVGLTIS
ncbi:GNAT family N-acetyltransferase [Streptomyces sp. P9(2023)]|uniref:GNAT family N-acetyltransferase n=1 Tax=Streptomyces sp. P9(2023) TaxID=3064394 RepID=UPI0028F41EC2|nr:GNAT family N-acetyltransferase [Streptomyces sp. P9(2023)]MDT9693120.1 GNAT family N-acetyltransferase [Streptomyces sp. P9(2023)]